MPTESDKGTATEDRARAFLERHGLACLERNVRCRFGEIDLVMRDGDTIVCVEVRYRQSATVVGAIDSIGPGKRRRLVAAASWYLSRHPRLQHNPLRFDVVAIDGRSAEHSALQWLRDAFRPGD